MKNNYLEQDRYKAAEKQVKEIKGFYIHLLVYVFINVAIITVSTYKDGHWHGLDNFWTYSTAFFWGIGLAAHWASVFGPTFLLGKKWEEKKIKELMEKEMQEKKKWE